MLFLHSINNSAKYFLIGQDVSVTQMHGSCSLPCLGLHAPSFFELNYSGTRNFQQLNYQDKEKKCLQKGGMPVCLIKLSLSVSPNGNVRASND